VRRSPSCPHRRPPPPPSCRLTVDERYSLCRSVAQECVQDEDLKLLLSKKANPIAYDGFEPSGRMHIAQGVMKALNVNKLTKAGCTFKFWVADWFAQLNNKVTARSARYPPPSPPPRVGLRSRCRRHPSLRSRLHREATPRYVIESFPRKSRSQPWRRYAAIPAG